MIKVLFLSIRFHSGNITKKQYFSKRIYMDLGKGIGLLIIGAIIGYGLSYTEKTNPQEVLISEEVSSEQTFKVEAATEFKDAIIVDNHDELDETKIEKKNNHKDISLLNEEDQKQALMNNYFSLQKKYHKSQRKIESLKRQINELDSSDATDEEMEALAPEPFSSFLSVFRGKTRNDIYDFHKEEEDLDWGYDKKNNILDYVITHYEGTNVDLISVTCKQPRCEILVTEKQKDAWKKMMKDIHEQTWWNFSEFTTTTKYNTENELSLYIFLTE
jgi:hypothetical protein